MAQATWEKPTNIEVPARLGGRSNRLKFLIGGLLILAAVAYLIISGTVTGARFFITVDELVKDSAYVGQTVRISGAVLGDSIHYDSEKLLIEFTIANIPQQFDNLAVALHDAVSDQKVTRLQVRVENQVKPDLLQHEAQAILTGKLDENGVFQATELLLKCPSRFQEDGPDPSSLNSQPEA
jgi:cytochrome c-type biogenesis protein CcmE